jgi:hypothetical protein
LGREWKEASAYLNHVRVSLKKIFKGYSPVTNWAALHEYREWLPGKDIMLFLRYSSLVEVP